MNKLLAVLGLQAFALQSNFWGGGKAFVKLDEDQLQSIEEALEKTGSAEDAQTITDLQGQVTAFEGKETEVQEALTAALTLNGLNVEEGQSPAEAIAALGAKCKEYGDSKNRHTFAGHNGQEAPEPGAEKLENGFFNANDAHNQIEE